MSNYQELNEVPAYTDAVWEDGKLMNRDAGLLWGGKDKVPPLIGAKIICTINNCGPAVVTGYFTLDGWLGVRCKLTNPPEWHVKQNSGNPNGHVFGPEYKMEEEA